MREDTSARAASPAGRSTSAKRAAMAAALAILGGLATPAARALPVTGTCHVTTYYSDASMTTQVGSYSTCPGSRGLTGRRTQFSEVDDIQIGTGPRPKPPGASNFPCELQQNCVTNLPTPTVVEPWPPKKKK